MTAAIYPFKTIPPTGNLPVGGIAIASFRSLPISVIGIEHPVIVGIATIHIGAFEHRRLQAPLHQVVHHLADQGLGDGDAGKAGGGADGGIQAIYGEGGIAGLAPIVDGYIGDLVHLLSGAVPGGAVLGVLEACHGDDLCSHGLGRQAHLHGHGVAAGIGDDQDGVPFLHPVELDQGLGIALHPLQVSALVGHLVEHQLRGQDGVDQGQAARPEVELLGDHVGVAGAEDIELSAPGAALRHELCGGLNMGHLVLQHLPELPLGMIKKACCCFHGRSS